MPRQPAAPAARQSIGIRPRTELKQALEKIAAENGRSLAQEVERRLEQSLEAPVQISEDPLPGIFSEEMRTVLRGSRPLANFVETVADAVFHAIKAANERGRDEIEVRTAARAAMNVVADRYFWRGEDTDTPVEPPLAPLGARVRDYPPAHLGYMVADQRVTWLSTWRDEDAALDRSEGRIRDLYSGNGHAVLVGPSDEEVCRMREQAGTKSILAKLAAVEETPGQLNLYKPVRSDPPVSDESAHVSSLKDLTPRR